MNRPTIIFLDLDGVVHSFGHYSTEKFVYLPRIEGVLRDFPETCIVICSDWRKNTAWSEILSIFADDIRPRVIGATPVFTSKDYHTGLRYAEAQAFLKDNQLDPERWIALDDFDDNWIVDPRVIVCDDGFFDREENLLRAALSFSPGLLR